MASKHFSPEQVNRRRREAVRLRLDGVGVAEAARRAGVSAPTVTAALRAFRQGGWPAVDVGPRGRPRKARRAVDQDLGATLRALLDEDPGRCWDVQGLSEAVKTRTGVCPDARAVRRYLSEWGLVPRRRPMPRGRTGPVGRCLDWAARRDAALLVGALRDVPGEAGLSARFQLTAQDA
ncbi:MAG: helix-turn-helix domain-containing protein, partial [Guyparkeria sp.]